MTTNFFRYSCDAYVTDASINGDTVAFAFGDGAIALVQPPYDEPQIYNGSQGIIHAISSHGEGFLFGDEYGHLKTITRNGSISLIHTFENNWVEHITYNQRLGLSGIAAGKKLALWDGKRLQQFSDHPSTVSGIAFAAKGNCIAAAHYNGITIWTPDSDKPFAKHIWKGSHLSISWSPDMKYILTGTQEMDLHVFDLPKNNHLYMSGYQAKIRSFSWNLRKNTLFTSGATQVLGWNFSGKGPAGKKPLSLGPDKGALVTQVSCHPTLNNVAAGYDNGSLLLIDSEKNECIPVFTAEKDAITLCEWNLRGDYLLYGTKNGTYGFMRKSNI